MTSIARTLTVSLSVAVTAIFLILLGIVIWRYQAREREFTSCRVAATILSRATVIEGNALSIRPTDAVEALKVNSPSLWYVVSSGALINEFGQERRPALPFAFPYSGPVGFSVFNTLDQQSTFCLAVIRRSHDQLAMMIGNPQPRFGQVLMAFVSRNLFSISLLAMALGATVVISATLTTRFVSRSIARVTQLALAINPAAPQGLIALSEVPRELKQLVDALNRAFGEIDAYIQMQRRFLGNAAHQLRTPLTLLRAKVEDVPDPALKIQLVRDVRRLSSLVSAMLDLARLQNHAIERGPVDLSTTTLDVLADFGPSALDAGIELSLEQAEDGPFVIQGVEAAIHSAIANLVGNALSHAHGARRITATLRYGIVSIHDDGMGLPHGDEKNLLEPFQTGNPTKEGAGLGLSIVQEIMVAHQGELVLTSSPGCGTTASLRFSEALERAL